MVFFIFAIVAVVGTRLVILLFIFMFAAVVLAIASMLT